MDDFLRPVQSTRKVQNNIEKFESLRLNERQTTRQGDQTSKQISTGSKRPIVELVSPVQDEPALKAATKQPTAFSAVTKAPLTSNHKNLRHHASAVFTNQSYLEDSVAVSLPDNAREILKQRPSHEDLAAVLQYLRYGIQGRHSFDIRSPGPQAAQIINVVVSITIPDIWVNLRSEELSRDEAQIKKDLVAVLSNVAGIGALLAHIKQLSASPDRHVHLLDMVDVLADILKGSKFVSSFLHNAHILYEKDTLRTLYWREVTAFLAGSRVLSIVSQALSTDISLNKDIGPYIWLAHGAQYCDWLAKNIANAAVTLNAAHEDSWAHLSQLVKRGMGLGHRDAFVAELYTSLLLGSRVMWTPIHLMVNHLSAHEQKMFFESILSDVARKFLPLTGISSQASLHDPAAEKSIAAAAALVAGLVKNNEVLQTHIEALVIGESGTSMPIGLSSRRALIATLGRFQEKLQRVLEKSLANFGDKLNIQHAPILQQEATTETILLAIGYLSRIDAGLLRMPTLSTLVMHAVSNRLAASVPKPRLLGMIVGTAVSRVTDRKENVLDFGIEEMDTEEVTTWLDIVSVEDHIGDINDMQPVVAMTSKTKLKKKSHPGAKSIQKENIATTSKIISIEELTDSSDDEDGLAPYQKPDSDAEDSEEDPTLINRAKPSAPVYITDLVNQLQMTDKPDVVSLALKTGPPLIRRKAAFGTELSENIERLLTVLVNLQEISSPELQRMQLDSMIACVVAKANLVGPSLADLYFNGDFSIAQRIALLTAIGLAARDLAGFKDDQSVQLHDDFPSKRLPAHLEPQPQQSITATRNPVAMLTNTAAHTTIRPMALAAADKVTGPSALKIRTFSSRMEVEKKTQEKATARTKIIPKNLHKLLTESLYLPLCSRLSLTLSKSFAARSLSTTALHSSTLRLFLQTLTLILHTLGPSASLQLPTITHETLLLLINLHNISYLASDPAVLPTLLHLLLALLDVTIEAGVTAQERLITDYGPQMSELVNWTNGLESTIGAPGAVAEEEGISWTILAAGIQVKWFEIGRRFQSRMLGLTMDEMDQLSGG